jgi:hypothetical protein
MFFYYYYIFFAISINLLYVPTLWTGVQCTSYFKTKKIGACPAILSLFCQIITQIYLLYDERHAFKTTAG